MPLTLTRPQTAGAAKPRKSVRGQQPTKRSINLAAVNEKKLNWRIGVPAILLILVAAALFGKFFVADRIAAVSGVRREAAALQRQLDDGYDTIASFGELTDKYAHYTYSGMTEEELSRADRVAVIDLIRRVALPRGTVGAWSLTGNQLTMSFTAPTLADVNAMASALEEDETVSFTAVSSAVTNLPREDEPESVTASVIVYLRAKGGDEA